MVKMVRVDLKLLAATATLTLLMQTFRLDVDFLWASLTDIQHVGAEEVQPIPFQGSKRTAISYGMDRLQNVCVEQPSRKRQYLKILSFTNDSEPLKQIVGHGPSWAIFTQQTVRRNVSEWDDYIAQNTTLHIQDETLLAVNIFGNPGHCLNDLVFSIALDIWQRNLSSTSAAYPHFVSSWFTTLSPGFDEDSWCLQFLHTARIIDKTSALERIAPITCFDSLLVPNLGVHRFPIDWSDTNTIKSLERKHWRQHFGLQSFPPLENNVTVTNMYPVEALEGLQKRLWKGLQVEISPQQPILKSDENEVSIFLYNRQGRKRFWDQSYEFAAILQKRVQGKSTNRGKRMG